MTGMTGHSEEMMADPGQASCAARTWTMWSIAPTFTFGSAVGLWEYRTSSFNHVHWSGVRQVGSSGISEGLLFFWCSRKQGFQCSKGPQGTSVFVKKPS